MTRDSRVFNVSIQIFLCEIVIYCCVYVAVHNLGRLLALNQKALQNRDRQEKKCQLIDLSLTLELLIHLQSAGLPYRIWRNTDSTIKSPPPLPPWLLSLMSMELYDLGSGTQALYLRPQHLLICVLCALVYYLRCSFTCC